MSRTRYSAYVPAGVSAANQIKNVTRLDGNKTAALVIEVVHNVIRCTSLPR